MAVVGKAGWIVLLIVLIVVAPPGAEAQEPPGAPQDKPAERSTGLPTAVAWTFNFDAGWGTFGFGNSLFDNPREPDVQENLSDQWFEGYIKPALSAVYTLKSTSEIYGRVSAVGERTYGSVPADFGEDISSFGPEDLSIGWRSGAAFETLGENAVDVVVGRTRYELGHGMLLFDGAAEGGSRGGYWTNARRAFAFAAIGRVRPGPHLVEVFYLDRDDLPEFDTDSRLWGANYEWSPSESTTIGATYMKWSADAALVLGRDGLGVFNVRAYTAPLPRAPDLSFEFEYAAERNGDVVDSNAWTLQAGYTFTQAAWTPTLSYRYAAFQGDDPETAVSEAFDPLLPGFSDWGSWWQGEIAGEYFLANSNLTSHLVRVHVAPAESVGAGLLLYKFRLDRPEALGVTDRDVAFEADLYVDWSVNEAFTVSLVGAFANPDRAVAQATGRTKNFAYGMVYVAYGF